MASLQDWTQNLFLELIFSNTIETEKKVSLNNE